MPVTRPLVWVTSFALSAALLTAPAGRAGPQPQQPPEPLRPRVATDVEVRYVDDSLMKLKLLDAKLELVTRFGVLHVPVAEVRRIDFATRVPAAVAEKVTLAVGRLNHPEFRVREAATAELKGYRERAYPYVLKAIKNDDPEVSRRADEVVKYIQTKVPPANLETRDTDVIITDDSRFSGRLTAESFRVGTFQFGEQQLQLADLRTLRGGSGPLAEGLAVAPPAPGNLAAYQQQFGKELTFAVTAFTPTPGANLSLWGTDVYTLDSNLTAAVVHAGLATPGETVTVTVRIVQPPPQFVATFRNNVTSTAYGAYPAGAYEFVRR